MYNIFKYIIYSKKHTRPGSGGAHECVWHPTPKTRQQCATGQDMRVAWIGKGPPGAVKAKKSKENVDVREER